MNYILFEDHSRKELMPFTYTRPVSEIRIGILKITEKWEKQLNASVSFQTEEYLSGKFPKKINKSKPTIWINGKVCPNAVLVKEVNALKENEVLLSHKTVVAANIGKGEYFDPEKSNPKFKARQGATKGTRLSKKGVK